MRLALIGWGAIAQATAKRIVHLPVQVVAVAVRDIDAPRSDLPASATLISDPSELASTKPDVVLEAAGRASVGPWGRASLEAGVDFVVASVSAFADPDLLTDLTALAVQNGAQLQITPGALGGIDALSAARSMGIRQVEHRMVKPPLAWLGTPAEALCDLENLREATVFFSGSADQAASQFPKNANVAMTTALAGLGPSDTKITLVADPVAAGNRHEVVASGDFGEMSVVMRNNALPENPKSSAMTALSLVRIIQNRISPVAI